MIDRDPYTESAIATAICLVGIIVLIIGGALVACAMQPVPDKTEAACAH